jgi:hypothetical protein
MAYIIANESSVPDDAEGKSKYEILRDTRIVELAERFKLVETALQEL